MSALQVSTVLACVNIIANGIASLPIHVYEQSLKNGRLTKIVAHEHDLYDLLAFEPNPEMSSPVWRKTVQAHALLWGNAYVEIQRDGANRVRGLWPRNPARTRPVRAMKGFTFEGTVYPAGTMVYETYESMADSRIYDNDSIDNEMTPRRIILAEDMIHLVGTTLDGRLGQNTVQLARQAIGLALATEKYGAKFFGNGAIPAGLLKTVGDITPEQWEVLSRSWQERHGGENMHKTGVLPPGVEYQKTGAMPGEGQFLEVRKFQRIEIASVFNVPPHMLGEIERVTRGSIEQSAIEFVLFAIGPWLSVWEAELRRKLFPNKGRSAGRYLVKFDTRKLIYPDATSRSNFYASGKQWGFLNTNDIREYEDINPVSGKVGEMYWMPVNMQDCSLAAHVSDNAHEGLDSGKIQAVPGGTMHKSQLVTPKPPVPLVAPGKEPDKIKPGEKKPAKKRSVDDYVTLHAGLFLDGLGRAFNRTGANRTDYLKIFSAPLANLANVIIYDMLNEVPGSQPIDEGAMMRYILTHIEGMFMRSGEWNVKDVKELSLQECKNAVEAITKVVSHEMGIVAVEAREIKKDNAFYVARHGTTPMNVKGLYREWTDADLDDQGIVIMEAAAEVVKGLSIRRIVSSDLVRAKHSAEIVSSCCGIPIELDEGLRSWHHGFGGMPEADYSEKLDYLVQHPDEIPSNGESLNAFVRRNQEALDKIQAENAEKGPTLAITSSSNLASYNDDNITVYSERAIIQPGGIVRIEKDGSKTIIHAGDEITESKKPS